MKLVDERRMNKWIDNNLNRFRSYMLGIFFGLVIGFVIAMVVFA